MHVVYLVDRYVTGTLKELSDWLTAHRITFARQKLILKLGMIAWYIYLLTTWEIDLWVSIMFPLVFLWWLFKLGSFVLMLVALHERLDPAMLHSPKRELSHGHLAWAMVITTLLCFGYTILFEGTFITPIMAFFTLYGIERSYAFFVNRRENTPPPKRKPKEQTNWFRDYLEQLRLGLRPTS